MKQKKPGSTIYETNDKQDDTFVIPDYQLSSSEVRDFVVDEGGYDIPNYQDDGCVTVPETSDCECADCSLSEYADIVANDIPPDVDDDTFTLDDIFAADSYNEIDLPDYGSPDISLLESFEALGFCGEPIIKYAFNKDENILIGPNGIGKTSLIGFVKSTISILRTVTLCLDDKDEAFLDDDCIAAFAKPFEVVHMGFADKNGKSSLKISILVEQNRRLRGNIDGHLYLPINILIDEVFHSKLTSDKSVPTIKFTLAQRIASFSGDKEAREKFRLLFKSANECRIGHCLASRNGEKVLPRLLKGMVEQIISSEYGTEKDESLKRIADYCSPGGQSSNHFRSLILELKDKIDRMLFNYDGMLKNADRNPTSDFRFVKQRHDKINEFLNKDFSADVDFEQELEKLKCPLGLEYYNNVVEEIRHIVNKFKLFISLFEEKISSRSCKRKVVYINEDGCFKIKCSIGDVSYDYRIEDLSSGELNYFTLMYDLIFKSEKNTIYFVDEPEISLHVEWQMQIMDDIQAIKQRYGGPQVIVITHSPFVAEGHEELIAEPYYA